MGSDIPSLVGGNYKPINQGSEIMNGFGYYWGEKKAASLSKPDHSCLAIQARCKKKKKGRYLRARDRTHVSFRFGDGGYLGT